MLLPSIGLVLNQHRRAIRPSQNVGGVIIRFFDPARHLCGQIDLDGRADKEQALGLLPLQKIAQEWIDGPNVVPIRYRLASSRNNERIMTSGTDFKAVP